MMFTTMIGLSLVVASGCAINNCIDRDIDAKMQRTRNRVTVTGDLSVRAVMIYGIKLQSWARQVFGFSIVTITALSVIMALDF